MLGNFTNITSLDLSHNNFGGQIPWSSFDLGKLEELDLSGNFFIGQLPNFCDNSTQISISCHSSQEQVVSHVPITLEGLFLDDNQFSGNIEEFNRSYLLFFFVLLATN